MKVNTNLAVGFHFQATPPAPFEVHLLASAARDRNGTRKNQISCFRSV